jgi:alpha-galactosidase
MRPAQVTPEPAVHVLSAGSVSVIVDVGSGLPRIVHWGPRATHGAPTEVDLAFAATLHESQAAADGLVADTRLPAVLPQQSSGWTGTPGLDGHREGRRFSTMFGSLGSERHGGPDERQTLVTRAADPVAELLLTTTIECSAEGVVRLRADLTNAAGDSSYTVNAMRLVVPVPAEAAEILDFAGRHLRERTPQRLPFAVGTHLREGRRGRTGSDAPVLLCAGTPGFGFRSGEVWAVHTAWSGNHVTFAEQGLTGARILGGGELLLPGEIVLGPNESYSTPWIYAVYGEGLDAVAGAFHSYLRARPQHPTRPRPVVLNTWEAVYYEHDLESLVELATLGAKVGVERFVLDDGWFLRRRSERTGLGDWRVDPEVWPHGLHPLADAVRGLGMQFGLWFEPEMANEDSDLARAHPEWILGPGERLPLPGREQQVVNLAIPEAWVYVLESVSAIVEEYRLDYIKWDHNRDLAEPGDRATGRPRAHQQTRAVYAMMDELRRRHPHMEIESCSSGGGRVDLEVLERTDRIWASDCLDPHERQRIQRWTGLLVPPELIGAHVGAPTAHTTRRTHTLTFRAATALFGHFGIEWDLRTASMTDLDELAAWVALYKRERELLHSGTTVHDDYMDQAYWTHGVVSPDRRQALFAFVAMDTSLAAQPGRLRLPGLDPLQTYAIKRVQLTDAALVRTRNGYPSWWDEGARVTGRALAAIGLEAPMVYPDEALLFRLVAVDPTSPRTHSRR